MTESSAPSQAQPTIWHGTEGHPVVVVLHDINLACDFATHVAIMKDGRMERFGAPSDILQASVLSAVFGVTATPHPPPAGGNARFFFSLSN